MWCKTTLTFNLRRTDFIYPQKQTLPKKCQKFYAIAFYTILQYNDIYRFWLWHKCPNSFWGSLQFMYCKCVMVNTIKGSWVSVYGAYLCLHMCVWAVVWAAGAVSNSSSWGGCYSAVYRTMQRSIPWLRHHHRDGGRDGKTTELICHSRAITHTHTSVFTLHTGTHATHTTCIHTFTGAKWRALIGCDWLNMSSSAYSLNEPERESNDTPRYPLELAKLPSG